MVAGYTNLRRVRLGIKSAWRTPWQADTLLGALCSVAARTRGAQFLRRHLIEPMLAGEPPFVVSDGFPGDLLPIPVFLRMARWPDSVSAKALKRVRWASVDDFCVARCGRVPDFERLYTDADIFVSDVRHHNTLSRMSDTSIEGELFAREATALRQRGTADDVITIYFRARDEKSNDLFLELLDELSLTGFGADVATGHGQFTILGGPEPSESLGLVPSDADGVVALSTFQPAPSDPCEGVWEAFPKFGKVGPDLGLSDVRKRTLIMLRPGACFRTDPRTPFLGRALPMDLVLPLGSAEQLRQCGVEMVHPAFGLTVPAKLYAEGE